MKIAYKQLGMGVLLGWAFAGQLIAQELPSLEPIPSPAADATGGVAELPALNVPTPADPLEDLQPIPAAEPMAISPSAAPSSSVAPVTYDSPIVEGASAESTPALQPIVDQATSGPVILETPAVDFRPQPIQLQPEAIESQQVTFESPIVGAVSSQPALNSFNQPAVAQPTVTQVQPVQQPNIVEQPMRGHPVHVPSVGQSPSVSQPVYSPSQSTAAYTQVPVQQNYQRPVTICPQTTRQPQSRTTTQQKVVVKTTPKYYYYRVDAKPASVTRPPSRRQIQTVQSAPQTVILRQNVRPADVPRPQYSTRYYVAPPAEERAQKVQRAQYQQVQRATQQAPRTARPVNYTEVQVTETTHYRPVQVTETYQSTPRPATTIVVPVQTYVPFQPFRNAARRRW